MTENWGDQIFENMADVMAREIQNDFAEWISNPVNKAKKNLEESKKRWEDAVRDEIENNPDEHIRGEPNCCTYHEYTKRMEDDYKKAEETYKYWLKEGKK